MSSLKHRRIRNVSGFFAGVALLGLTVLSWGPRDLELPGVVEPGARFAIASDDSAVRWELAEHGKSSGLRVVSKGALQMENGEQIKLDVKVAPGAVVTKGQVLAVVDSEWLTRTLNELDAELKQVQARLNLVLDGGRPETIAAAGEEVEVARSRLAAAKTEFNRMQGMANDNAVAPAELDGAAALVDVRERELALARALLVESRLPPRGYEVAELEAQLAGVDSRLAEARQREVASTILSPVTGQVAIGNDTELLVVVADGDRYVRVPIPTDELSLVHLGDDVSFHTTGAARNGRVVDIARQAQPLGGRSVFWVAVSFSDGSGLSPGATGTAHFTGS